MSCARSCCVNTSQHLPTRTARSLRLVMNRRDSEKKRYFRFSQPVYCNFAPTELTLRKKSSV